MKKFLWYLLPLAALCGCSGGSDDDPAPKPSEVNLNLSAEDFSPPPAGGTKTVTITTSAAWTSEIVPAAASSWLSLTPTNGQGTAMAVVKANASDESATRTASVKITAGKTTRTIAISQDASALSHDLGGNTLNLSMDEQSRVINVTTNITPWTVECTGGGTGTATWCTAAKDGNKVTVSVKMNSPGGGQRTANLHIAAGALYRDIAIIQAAYANDGTYYADRDVVTLQTHSQYNGIPMVLIGDGYTISSMKKGSGKYETDMRAAAEHFFSTYPFSAYRTYFDVTMVVAVSAEAGMDNLATGKTVSTALESVWSGGGSTRITCDQAKVFAYVRAISKYKNFSDYELTGTPMPVIIPINENVYAGTCWYWSSGFSYGLCPVGSTFKNVVVHECGGHGFAQLADEYTTNSTKTIPETDDSGGYSKSQIRQWKDNSWGYENVDLNGTLAQTSWAGFAANPTKYSMVGAWEGAATYGFGVWRPEYNSCMNNNVLYFNAPSRYAQVRRIKQWSGADTNYTLAKFMAEDAVPAYPQNTRSPELFFIPLAPPVANIHGQ